MNIVDLPARRLPGDYKRLTTDWLTHKAARGATANTVAAYAADLAHLGDYLARHGVTLVQLVSERMLNRWLDEGIVHLGWSRRTASRRMSSVRGFFAWLRAEALIEHDPAAEIRIRYRPRTVLAPELEPLRAVVAAIGTEHPVDLRDRAVLMLLLDAALRANEVAGLDLPARDAVHTVHLERQRVSVRPKGDADGATETVGIEEQTVASLRRWIKARPLLAREGERALFVNAHGRRMSRQTIYTMVRARGAAAGLPRLHPHLFRHRRIGEVAEKLGLDFARAQARHRHKSTTANIYGHHAEEVQREAIRRMVPLGRVG